VTNYSEARKLEHAARHVLEADGYWCMRSAGSKGTADIIAIKRGPGFHWQPGIKDILFIQCKTDGYLAPAERAGLVDLSTKLGATSLVASWHKEGRAARTVRFEWLDGDGTKRPWTPDYALEEEV
jgi:hypothetical protein